MNMKRLGTTFLFALVCAGVLGAAFAGEAQFKTRAIWVDPGSFASAGATDEMLARCARAGINLILPNVLSHRSSSTAAIGMPAAGWPRGSTIRCSP